jgi:threonine dehydrogenase-like Zn-dependent dehydrogenase
MYGAGDVPVEDVADPRLQEPTDAVVRVVRSAICGSDPWPYRSMEAAEQGRRMGHELLGVVEDLGAEVAGLQRGDLVVTPSVWADNACDFCTEGLHTSCRHGGRYGLDGVDGGLGEAVRVPPGPGHPGQAVRRGGLGPAGVAAHPLGCVLHRPGPLRDGDAQPHPHRRRRPGPGLHRAAPARRGGGQDRARAGSSTTPSP